MNPHPDAPGPGRTGPVGFAQPGWHHPCVLVSVVALVVAAACSGAAAVLQARAVDRTGDAGLAGLVGGLVRQPGYLAGLLLVGLGFLASLVAVQELPLFLVQAGRAASLGVTAVLAAVVLGTRLRSREVVALGVLAAGLAGVAVAAAPSRVDTVTPAGRGTVLVVAVLLLLVVLVGSRAPAGPRAAGLLGVLAGACFGVLSLAARVLAPVTVPGVLTDPAAWAVGVAGAAGLAGGALAMQRGGVVLVTAAMVATESVLGAVLGLAVGDRPVPGLGWLAVLGFATTLVGALLLARFGAPPVVEPALARAEPADDSGRSPREG